MSTISYLVLYIIVSFGEWQTHLPLIAGHCRGQEIIGYIDPATYATANLAGVNRTQYSQIIRFNQVSVA